MEALSPKKQLVGIGSVSDRFKAVLTKSLGFWAAVQNGLFCTRGIEGDCSEERVVCIFTQCRLIRDGTSISSAVCALLTHFEEKGTKHCRKQLGTTETWQDLLPLITFVGRLPEVPSQSVNAPDTVQEHLSARKSTPSIVSRGKSTDGL